jgi:quinolinate synthase
MKQAAPDRIFMEAPSAGEGATCESCAHCPWMAMNHLRNLRDVLVSGSNEIQVPEDIRRKALKATQRMVDFVADQG